MSATAATGGEVAPQARPREAAQPFRFALRVYYEDTDAAGVVYYANYLRYMERARTEWLRSMGFALADVEREHGVVFVVHRCEIDYRRPGRLEDELRVTVDPVEVGSTRLVVRQDVLRGDETLTRSTVSLACVDTTQWRPARIPPPLRHSLEAFR